MNRIDVSVFYLCYAALNVPRFEEAQDDTTTAHYNRLIKALLIKISDIKEGIIHGWGA